MRAKRHIANIMRPSQAIGSLGETQGSPEVVCRDWPCAISTVSGNDREQARQNGVEVTHEVSGYGSPAWKRIEQCYLQLHDGRRLNIVFVDDRFQNGEVLRLLCGETR